MKIPGLDGIRAAAALTVVAAHAGNPYPPAGFAVVMFFILSGLLITWLLLREAERDGSVDLRAFYIRRSFRLLPPLAALIACSLIFHRPPATTSGLMAAGLYYANYFVAFGGHPLGIGHTWSLAIEEHFYLIWPALFGRWLKRGLLLKGLITIAIVSASLRLVVAYGFSWLYAANATETNATAIAVGCALAVCMKQSPYRLPRFLFHQWLVAPALVTVCALSRMPIERQTPWATTLSVPLLAVVLIQAITFEWRILDNRVAYFLGRISYSIYLWHLVSIQVTRMLMAVSPVVLRPGMAFYFLVAVLMAAASYYWIERPAQEFGRRLVRRRKGVGRGASPIPGAGIAGDSIPSSAV